MFLLIRDGRIVSSAIEPSQLEFTKVSVATFYEVCVRIDDTVYPIAAIDLTGYKHCSDWVAKELCKEIDFRRAHDGFEDEIKQADGPIISFGKPNLGPDGRML